MGLVRLTDGTLDSSFGTDGIVALDYGGTRDVVDDLLIPARRGGGGRDRCAGRSGKDRANCERGRA